MELSRRGNGSIGVCGGWGVAGGGRKSRTPWSLRKAGYLLTSRVSSNI